MNAKLSTDDVMNDVKATARARVSGELAQLQPDSPLVAEQLLSDVEALYRRALEGRRFLLMPSLLLDDNEWGLDTSLRFTSHRPGIGWLLILVKRRVLKPMMRWLYDFSRDNFDRQARINDTLMATIDTLAAEIVLLRREVERLRGASPSAPA